MRKRILNILLSLISASCWADDRWMTIEGSLRDVLRDPTDTRYTFLYIQTSTNGYYAAAADLSQQEIERYENAFGSRICVYGELVPTDPTFSRHYCAREIRPRSPKNVRILPSNLQDPFAVPDVSRLWHVEPGAISSAGPHTVRGRVLATWDNEFVIVRTKNGGIVDAELRCGNPPAPGTTVDLVGYPETTIYNIRLNRAIWREAEPFDDRKESATTTDPEKILLDEWGKNSLNMRLHGQVLRLKGLVLSLPKAGTPARTMYLECDGYTIPVNTAGLGPALDGLEIGCTVEVTGICVMDVDLWRPNAVFTKVRGFTLVTRTPDDLTVISRPPWLTLGKLMAFCGALLLLLVIILVWNRALRLLAEKRGRQLADEQILRAESDLKVHERTRLAVELHDALSQNLAGIALQLKTVAALTNTAPAVAKTHLEIADRSLLSCREDLRNCLHDLRSDALEEKTMDAAIRKTLAPHIDTARLSIRFNVPRERFTDNAAHALLCIIRELVLNAIRHGSASEVKVAGAVEDGKLLVSVRDNGVGFDTTTRPGVKDGHFGLQGILERVQSFNGIFSLESTPGNGTKASFSIALPSEEKLNG